MSLSDEWGDYIPTLADYRALDAAHNGSQPSPDTWQPVNLAEIPDEPPQPPTLGGLGIAYPGKRHVFSGPQESAKTLCAYILGLQVLRAGGGFCLIDLEMGQYDARNRLREIGFTQHELARILYFEPDQPMTAEATARILNANPALILIDAAAGAYDLATLDDNKRADVERFQRTYITPFWKHQIATLVLDHVVKNAEARGNYAIGSERKVGGVDVHLGFTVVKPIKRGSTGLYKITTHKDRGGFLKRGHLADMALQSDHDTHNITWKFTATTETDEEHPFRPTVLMEKVSRWLELQPEAVSRRDVIGAIQGKAGYVREALNVLVAEGWTTEEDGANRTKFVTLQRAYRESLDDLPTGESRVSPGESRNPASASESVSPTPYGGDAPDAPTGETHSSESPTLYDDIPF